jgi:ABC-type Fe3+-hydroxamate transport system substrate-binding protein
MDRQTFIDQLSRKVAVNFPPKRIISIVPSQTELLFDLGLDEEIIGVTKFCTHPADKVKNKIKIGGTKKLDLNLIRSLKPDLIIGNKEENERGQVETLMQEFPVWMSDIADLPDAIQMITGVGAIVNRADSANYMAVQIGKNFAEIPGTKTKLRVAYLIWQNPYMLAGKNTFIDDMLQRCGFANTFDIARYPEITSDELQRANPDVIMLSSEPYPFKEKHTAAFRVIAPQSKVVLVDGEMFSWYGSHLLKAPGYFNQLISTLTR